MRLASLESARRGCLQKGSSVKHHVGHNKPGRKQLCPSQSCHNGHWGLLNLGPLFLWEGGGGGIKEVWRFDRDCDGMWQPLDNPFPKECDRNIDWFYASKGVVFSAGHCTLPCLTATVLEPCTSQRPINPIWWYSNVYSLLSTWTEKVYPRKTHGNWNDG